MTAVDVPSLGFIGLGKVGETLARLYVQRGYRVAAVSSRRPEFARHLAQVLGAKVDDPAGVMSAADLTLLAVPDDAIRSAAEMIRGDFSGKAIVHTSGVHDAAVLAPLAQQGAVTGSFHPAYPFSDVSTAAAGLPGSAFAIEAHDHRLRRWLIAMALALNGQVLEVPAGAKALYHAALVIASNYTVTLYALAEQILLHIGADKDAAAQVLHSLLEGTLVNLRHKGIPDALTGPLVRGDVGTLMAHLAALETIDQSLLQAYRLLARLSLPMVEARGTSTAPLQHLFEGKLQDDSADCS